MMQHLLPSLELAAAVTAGYLLVLAMILPAALPRLRARWQAHQPAQIPMPGADPAAVYATVVKTLAPWGFRAVGAPGGPFTLEPTGFRKRLGAKPITVTCPSDREGVITGEARYVVKFTTDRKVFFLTEDAVPFWPWVRQRLAAPVAVLTGILFVGVFFVFLSF